MLNSEFKFFNLINIIYSFYSFNYLNNQNYFRDNSQTDDLQNYSSPTELTDQKVANKLIWLAICLEFIILIKLFGIPNSSSKLSEVALKAFRFIQLFILSIFVTILLIVLLGSDLRSITSTVQLSFLICLLAIAPLLMVSFQNYYPYHFKTGQHFTYFLNQILRTPFKNCSFLIINFYALIFGCWLFAFLIKVDWTVHFKRYPIVSIIGLLFSNLSLNLLNLALILVRTFFSKILLNV